MGLSVMNGYEHHWDREYSLFYGTAALTGLRSWAKEIGISIEARGEGRSGWFSSFSKPAIRERLLAAFPDSMSAPEILQQVGAFEADGEAFITFARMMGVSPAMSDDELRRQYQQLFDAYAVYCASLWKSFYFAERASQVFEAALRAELPPERISAAIGSCSKPLKKTALVLISDYFAQEQEREKRIAYIEKSFPWIGSKDLFVEPWGREHAAAFVDAFASPKEDVEPSVNLRNRDALLFYQSALYVKDKRDEYRRQAFYLAASLVRDLAQRSGAGVGFSGMGFFLPSELPSAAELARRKKGYVVSVSGDSIMITSGDGARAKFLPRPAVQSTEELRGTVGCGGVARGIVQRVMGAADIQRFVQGKILVAPTTDASHVIAMQKAAAIVTDEGGMTCHAAIVAREMKKPCVVGTKTATSMLKDGDRVEVDADNGIVRIIT